MTPTGWSDQLADWQAWLDNHLDDPALIAGCHRIGRRLAGDGR